MVQRITSWINKLEKTAGIEWWMIILPILVLAIGGGSALIIVKRKNVKNI